MMVRRLSMGLLTTAALAVPGRVQAQAEPPRLWLIPDGDDVVVQLAVPPQPYHGFQLDRILPDGTVTRVTPGPVRPVRGTEAQIAALGEALPVLRQVTRSSSDSEVLSRIRGTGVGTTLFAITYPTVADMLGRRFRHEGVGAGGTATYRVVFLNSDGTDSDATLEASVTLEDRVPGGIESLEGTPRNGQARLEWSYPTFTGDPGDVVVGFHVYRSESEQGPFQRQTLGPVLRTDQPTAAFTDPVAFNGVSYWYRVRAVDALGREGPASAAVRVTPVDPSPPLPPSGLVGEPGDASTRIAWQVASELDVVGYHVERADGLEAPYRRMTTELVPVEEPFYDDGDVDPGTQYFYRVVAVDGQGRESPPSGVVSLLPYDATPPEAPGVITATPDERRLTLTWTPSPSADVVGYLIYRGESGDVLAPVTADPVPDTSWVDEGFEAQGLVPGQQYLVRITAVDRSFNESTAAEVVVQLPDDEAPAPATGFRAENRLGRAVELRWSASPARDVVRYVLYRGGADAPALDSASAAGDLRLVDEDVEGGESYSYLLVAVDSAGNRSEPARAEIDFVDESAPPAPNFIQVAVTDGGARVIWERVASPDLAGYRVYRVDIPTGVFVPVSGLVPPGSPLEFTDPSGAAGLHYRVVAVDRSGNESEPSAVVRAGGGE